MTIHPITAQLAEILSTVQRPGSFFVADELEFYNPQLEVNGMGVIALPLLPVQAEQLIAMAEQAPYGRGEDTLIDADVRRTWQITPDHVQLKDRHWPQTLETIVTRCAEGLGVNASVSAELYKLLVYDEGSFFVSHRDTEKAPGMFATLIVVLPSQHDGGELLIRHRDQQVRLELGGTKLSEISFAAFYADCVHEILPITAGYRLALVYNLIRQGKGKPPQAPNYDTEQTRLATLLQQWCTTKHQSDIDDTSPEKLIYPLEHVYTPAELSFDALKGADAAAAVVCTEAAQQADCDLHLTLVTIEESGIAEHSYYYGSRRRWSAPEEDDFEIVEVTDQSQLLSQWQRPDGEPSQWGELPFFDEELCPPASLEGMEPDEQYFHEATGNEGASFERTYRRAALVLWPRERRLAILNQAGLTVTLPYLADLIDNWHAQENTLNSPLWQQAHELADHMLRTWSAPSWNSWHSYSNSSPYSAQMLSCLVQLQDSTHIDMFLSQISAQGHYQKDNNQALIDALALLEIPRATDLLEQIMAANVVTALDGCAELLTLTTLSKPFKSHKKELHRAAVILLESLPGDPTRAADMQPWRRSKANAENVVDVLTALNNINIELAQQAAHYMLQWPKSYHLDDVLLPAALAVKTKLKNAAAIQQLRDACLTHLRTRIAEPLAPPEDWTRASKLKCQCTHCSELSQFLADPEREVWTFKAAEAHRRHVTDTIRRHQCDVTTRTDKQGRPYKLICTKNQASYERRAKQRKQDLKHLAKLEKH